jgi:hypothetical protein
MSAEFDSGYRLRLLLNGETKATAGLESFGVLSQTLSWVRRDPEKLPNKSFDLEDWVCNKVQVRLGGLDSTTGEHFDWFVSEIGPGDEVTIRILPQGEFDPPAERHTFPAAPRPRRPRNGRWKRQVKGPSWRKRQ